jgi:putative DNA primase/helicase
VQAPHDTVATLHRIYLTPAGEKANVPSPKKSMPPPTTVRGAAVRLDIPTDILAVTEGIETGLAVRLSAGVPVWAGLSAVGMSSMIIPQHVRLVVIAADHDATGTGKRAADTLACRLLAESRRVKMLMPTTPGVDWADGIGEGHHGGETDA